jgi:hypothetical protein
MSIHDYPDSGHSSYDHNFSTLDDGIGQNDLASDRHARFDPSNLAGDYHLFYENREIDSSFNVLDGSYNSKLPIARIVIMLMLGFWGGIVVSIVLSVI